ncbi:MAG: response regulator [Deltaproteobacteria bacterium]|nr:response regulator [Deltaproteobacteria bacterium]
MEEQKNFDEVVDWLIKLETSARDFYRAAATHFKEDALLSEFLSNLAMDEDMHLDIILKGSELIKKSGGQSPALAFAPDAGQMNECIGALENARQKVKASSLTKEELLETAATLEFSEWNDIFIYIINALKSRSRMFVPSAVNLEKHRSYIIRYLEKTGNTAILEKVSSIPQVWTEKILLVDDSGQIRTLLKAVVANMANTDTADDGRNALEKVNENYFAVIVSDVDMPNMNGIEFYKEAVGKFPRLKDRFLFFTAKNDDQTIKYFTDNGIRHLIKPAPIKDIRQALKSMLGK